MASLRRPMPVGPHCHDFCCSVFVFCCRCPKLFLNSCAANGPSITSSSVRRNEFCSERDSKHSINKIKLMLQSDKDGIEDKIEQPLGILVKGLAIKNNPRCNECETKGLVICATCSGSGLYIDSIMESQGILVKVRCLGCGGSGTTLCAACGGRGHL